MWTTPLTITTGQKFHSSFLNTQIRDNMLFLYSPPGAKVMRTSNVEITSTGQSSGSQFEGSYIEFDQVVYDNDEMTVTDSKTTLESKTSGVYLLTGASYVLGGSGTDYGIQLGIAVNAFNPSVAGFLRVDQICHIDGSAGAMPVGLNAQTIHDVPAGTLIALLVGLGPGPLLAVVIGAGPAAPFGGRGPMLAAHWMGN